MNGISPDVSIIIVSYNTRDLLKRCLSSLLQESSGINCEIIVIDNGSDKENSADVVTSQFPGIKLIVSDINVGFGAANNMGFRIAKGRYIALLNSDAFLHPNALSIAIEKMDANPKIGLGGAKLVGEDGSWQPSARMFPSPLNDFLYLSGLATKYPHSRFFGRADRTWAPVEEPTEVDWVPGAFSIIRREVLEQIGYFDERFFLYYEEVDLCKRIKNAEYSIWYWPDVIVTHLGGETCKKNSHLMFSSSGSQLVLWRMRSALLYFRKHHGLMGAYATRFIEQWWHTLRAKKNSMSQYPKNQSKRAESQTSVQLMRQAWKETNGGKTSPSRPW